MLHATPFTFCVTVHCVDAPLDVCHHALPSQPLINAVDPWHPTDQKVFFHHYYTVGTGSFLQTISNTGGTTFARFQFFDGFAHVSTAFFPFSVRYSKKLGICVCCELVNPVVNSCTRMYRWYRFGNTVRLLLCRTALSGFPTCCGLIIVHTSTYQHRVVLRV